ncbi:MAG: hypothetical protein P1U61_08660 [Legionellaceae bacterium]|nr:hypothetical protein [Legionellaceae bacterium]
MKAQLIDDILEAIQTLIFDLVGDIPTPSGTVFSPQKSLKFRNKLTTHIEEIEAYFEGDIPNQLLSVIVAHVARQVLESSPAYQAGIRDLVPPILDDVEHALHLVFTPEKRVKRLREEPSHRDLADQRPVFEAGYHGEFAYALLHILNHHALYVPRKDVSLMSAIAETIDRERCIARSLGSKLAWRDVSKYAIGARFADKKREFCELIDTRRPLSLLDEHVIEPAPDGPVTLALWNRNAPEDRDPNRRLGLKVVQEMVMHVKQEIGERSLRLLLVGDSGRLTGIRRWAEAHDIQCHDHRNEHMVPKMTPAVEGRIPKDEQLYHARNIMKKFNPALVIGSRSGLVALCALVGCPGLQIDVTRSKSTVVKRVQHTTSVSKKSIAESSGTVPDKRLLEVFVRCPVDGIGPHVALDVDSPNPDNANVTPSSSAILRVIISVMLVSHEHFKPLMLETLASYLAGDKLALQRLELLLHTYRLSQFSFKKNPVTSLKSAFDDLDHDDGHDNSHDDGHKDSGSDCGGREKDLSDNNSSTTSPSGGSRRSSSRYQTHQARLFQYKGIVMNSETFFKQFKEGKLERCQFNFSSLSLDEKSVFLIDAILKLDVTQFEAFYTDIIPEDEQYSLLVHDEFIAFEHALAFPQHLKFLLDQIKALEGEATRVLADNENYLLCCAIEYAADGDKTAFEVLKSAVDVETWTQLLMAHESVIVRSMAEHIDANYAWEQCASLGLLDKNKILRAKDYTVFCCASVLENRMALLNSMRQSLTEQEFISGVNAYGGDVVYNAVLQQDQVFFNAYYPMLNETVILDLRHRITTDATAHLRTFNAYEGAWLASTTDVDVTSHVVSVQQDEGMRTPPPSPKAKGKKPQFFNTPPSVISLNISPEREVKASMREESTGNSFLQNYRLPAAERVQEKASVSLYEDDNLGTEKDESPSLV